MSIHKAAELLRHSSNTVVLTGAGISTPSGIPDFRSNGDGLWNKVDPMQVASLETFRTHPENFFDWIRPLAQKITNAKPNAAHIALSEMEQRGFVSSIITQNIDRLHHDAGSKIVHEIHGNVGTMTCVSCYRKESSAKHMILFFEDGLLPKCPHCGHILKPDAILFGEQLPVKTWQASEIAIKDCDVLMVAGSSLEVMPVAGLPMQALNKGAKLIILNHTPTYINNRASVVINDDLATILPIIANELH